MAEKIKLKLGQVAGGVFIQALGKLCQLNLHSGRDTYALSRTLDALNPELDSYTKTKESLLKKHGAISNLAALHAKLASFAGGTADHAEVAKQLASLAPMEQLQLPATEKGYAPFMEELKSVNETEVELFLDHKVPLPLDKIDGIFTPFELKELESTVVDIKM